VRGTYAGFCLSSSASSLFSATSDEACSCQNDVQLLSHIALARSIIKFQLQMKRITYRSTIMSLSIKDEKEYKNVNHKIRFLLPRHPDFEKISLVSLSLLIISDHYCLMLPIALHCCDTPILYFMSHFIIRPILSCEALPSIIVGGAIQISKI